MLHFYLQAFVISLFSLVLCSNLNASSRKLRLLIDTDVGLGKWHDKQKTSPADIDDAYAIINALRSTQIDIVGMTTVFGNTQVGSVDESVGSILKISKNEHIPWVSGAIEAGNKKKPCPIGANGAADFIASRLKHSPAYLLAIGPLTNIACMLASQPDLSKQIQGILVVMGQSENIEFSINNVTVQDLNFESDIHAAETLINSKVPMAFFPFELTRKSLVKRQAIEAMKSHDKLLRFFKKESIHFINHWYKVFKEDGFHPWDSAPVAYLKSPKWFKCEKREMLMERQGGKLKLLAKQKPNNLTPWNFCYDFANKNTMKKFEDEVLTKLIQKGDQS
ncbi:MAG: nucleoside hydrolase [Oligoflexales bacterium]|nr:nucleoside hydrolase [Oligoflexales bacterium]